MVEVDDGAPVLVLGPMLLYVGETAATIWVQTDRACQDQEQPFRRRRAGDTSPTVAVG